MALNKARGFLEKTLGVGVSNIQQCIKDAAERGPEFKTLYEGWVEKKGDLNKKGWQKRYFIFVAPRTLFYFTDHEKANAFRLLKTDKHDSLKAYAKGGIPVSDSSVVANAGQVDDKQHCFSVKPKADHKRVFMVSAPNSETKDLWMRALAEGEKFRLNREPAREKMAATSLAHVATLLAMFEQIRATNVLYMRDLEARIALASDAKLPAPGDAPQPQVAPAPQQQAAPPEVKTVAPPVVVATPQPAPVKADPPKPAAEVFAAVNRAHVCAVLAMFEQIRSANAVYMAQLEARISVLQ